MNNKLIRSSLQDLKGQQSLKITQFINEYQLRKHQFLDTCPIDQTVYGSKEKKKRNQALIALNKINISNNLQIKKTVSIIKQIQQTQKQKFAKKEQPNSQLSSITDIFPSSFKKVDKKGPLINISKTEQLNQSAFRVNRPSDILSNNQFVEQVNNQSVEHINFNDLQSFQSSKRQSGSPIDQEQFPDYQSSIRASSNQQKIPITIMQDPNQSEITEQLIHPPQQSSLHLSDKSSLQFYLQLQNFETKQSALIKSIFNGMHSQTTKMPVFRKLKSLKWEQLDLPRPQIKYMGNLNYAKVIN